VSAASSRSCLPAIVQCSPPIPYRTPLWSVFVSPPTPLPHPVSLPLCVCTCIISMGHLPGSSAVIFPKLQLLKCEYYFRIKVKDRVTKFLKSFYTFKWSGSCGDVRKGTSGKDNVPYPFSHLHVSL